MGRKVSGRNKLHKKTKSRSKDNSSDIKDIFYSSRDGMVLMDCESWDVIDVNSSFEEMLGYSLKEVIGKKLWDVPADGNKEILKEKLFEVFQKGTCHIDSVPVRTKSNGLVNLEVNTSIIDEDDQKSMLCICRPMDDGANLLLRNASSMALKGNKAGMEQFSKELLENANLIILFTNTEGRITLFNRKAEEFTGKSCEEVYGKKFYDVLFPFGLRDKLKLRFDELVSGTNFIESHEFPLRNSEGLERLIHWRNSLISNSTSGVLGVLSIGEDVTDLKLMERRLKLYSDAIRSSIDSMIITDLNGYIIYNNRATEKMYGYNSGELVGKKYFVLFPSPSTEDSRIDPNLIKMLEDKGSWEGEVLQKRKNGISIHVNQTMSLIKDDRSKAIAIMIVGRDISTSKNLEQELREAKGTSELLLDILIHDLNNINQGVMTQLDLLKNRSTSIAHQKYYLESASGHLQSGIRLINNVKKLANIKYIYKEKSFKPYDPGYVIDESLKRVMSFYPQREIQTWGNYKEKWPMVNADEFIFELFVNLLDNAVKYDRRKQVQIGINLMKMERNSKPFLKISIVDSGTGISPTQRKEIFKRFRSGSKSITDNSGLGLAIVKSLVDRYDGKIWIEDRVVGDYSKGSIFCILMPVHLSLDMY